MLIKSKNRRIKKTRTKKNKMKGGTDTETLGKSKPVRFLEVPTFEYFKKGFNNF